MAKPAAAQQVPEDSGFETRIDEPPLVAPQSDSVAQLLGNVKLEAMLQVGSTRVQKDGVFVIPDSAFVLQAASNWDESAVKKVFTRQTFFVGGKMLTLAGSRLIPTGSAPNVPLAYAARANYGRERQNFVKMMRLIDYPFLDPNAGPQFFSDNIGSLAASLTRLASAEIAVRDTGTALEQTVTYRLVP
jgi:hypothetical protein